MFTRLRRERGLRWVRCSWCCFAALLLCRGDPHPASPLKGEELAQVHPLPARERIEVRVKCNTDLQETIGRDFSGAPSAHSGSCFVAKTPPSAVAGLSAFAADAASAKLARLGRVGSSSAKAEASLLRRVASGACAAKESRRVCGTAALGCVLSATRRAIPGAPPAHSGSCFVAKTPPTSQSSKRRLRRQRSRENPRGPQTRAPSAARLLSPPYAV